MYSFCMTLNEALEKCKQLAPSVRMIGELFVEDAFAKDMTFRIAEVRRTYERQCLLLSQGRTRLEIVRNQFPYGFTLNQQQMRDMLRIYDNGMTLQGPKVTWTLNSEHLVGKAMDIYPIKTTYAELGQLAGRWNIRQNIPGDLPHFSFSRAYIPKPTYIPLERLAQLQKRIERASTQDAKDALERMINRLKKRLGI